MGDAFKTMLPYLLAFLLGFGARDLLGADVTVNVDQCQEAPDAGREE